MSEVEGGEGGVGGGSVPTLGAPVQLPAVVTEPSMYEKNTWTKITSCKQLTPKTHPAPAPPGVWRASSCQADPAPAHRQPLPQALPPVEHHCYMFYERFGFEVTSQRRDIIPSYLLNFEWLLLKGHILGRLLGMAQ